MTNHHRSFVVLGVEPDDTIVLRHPWGDEYPPLRIGPDPHYAGIIREFAAHLVDVEDGRIVRAYWRNHWGPRRSDPFVFLFREAAPQSGE